MGDERAPIPISTYQAPAAIGPYSQGVISGGFVFVSGQLPINPETGDFVKGGLDRKIHQILKNIKAVLNEAGTDFSHVVKTTVFLTNMADFANVNKIYSHYFEAFFPARSVVQVAGLPKGSEILVEVIASVPDSGL